MIEREPDPENRRSVTVTLTERGRELVAAARPAYAERARTPGRGVPGEAPRHWRRQLQGLAGLLRARRARSRPRGWASRSATAAVAKRMRRAVGLPDERGRARRARRGGTAPADGRRPEPRRSDHAGRTGAPVRSVGDLERAVRAADGTLTLSVLRGAEPISCR